MQNAKLKTVLHLHSAFCNFHDMTEPPPILKTWRRLYALVLFVLGAEVVLFYIFTKAFE